MSKTEKTQENKQNPSVQGIEIKEEAKTQNQEVKTESKELTKEELIRDYENSIKRLQADFENYIKRTEKDKVDSAKYVAAKVVGKFLNIFDDLDRAMLILEKENNSEIKTGIQMIHKQFHKIMDSEGVLPMNCKGKKFDPYCHEIIDMVEHDSPEGIIVEELQKGYNLHDKVLRTAKVRISKGLVKSKASTQSEHSKI